MNKILLIPLSIFTSCELFIPEPTGCCAYYNHGGWTDYDNPVCSDDVKKKHCDDPNLFDESKFYEDDSCSDVSFCD